MKQKSYSHFLFLSMGLFSAVALHSQNAAPVFQDTTPADAMQVYRGNGAWGDYNNDGWTDLVVMGRSDKGDAAPSLTFYTNSKDGFSVSVPVNIPAKAYNTVMSWIDYNNDGNLDMLLVGSTFDGDSDGDGGKENAVFAKLYRNDGKDNGYSFTEIENCGIQGVFLGQQRNYSSVLSVGDYNNDGYPDIAFIGNRAGNKIEIYTNNNGTGKFSLLENPLDGTSPLALMNSGALAWGDYDGDGFLDLLVTGWINNMTNLKLYQNKGDGTFKEVLSQIGDKAPYKGYIGWLDANNDGKLDYLVSGETKGSTATWGKTTDIYVQNNGVFTKQENLGIILMQNSAADCADVNGDGLLDILASGTSNNLAKTFVAMNNGDKYTLTTATGPTLQNGFEGLRNGTSMAIYDYDNDGYLDFFEMGYNSDGAKLKIYQNTGLDGSGNIMKMNTPPREPLGLVLEANGDKTTFMWAKGSDQETAELALCYNLYIKKANGEIVMLIAADPNTGKLKVSDCTFATMSHSYTMNIAVSEIIEWGVQTIDQGRMSSAFAKQSVLCHSFPENGGWQAICLPFDMTKIVDEKGIALTADNYVLKELTSVYNGTLQYTEVNGGLIKANTPYIFSMKKIEDTNTQKKPYFIYGEEMIIKKNPVVEFSGYSFVGTYKKIKYSEEMYVLDILGEDFVKNVDNDSIQAYSAYIIPPAGTTSETIEIRDRTSNSIAHDEQNVLKIVVRDGVVEIEATQSEIVNIYGIDGCVVRNIKIQEGVNYVNGLLSGIYFVSGTKVLIH